MDSTVDIAVISFILQDNEIFMNATIFFITAINKYIYDVLYFVNVVLKQAQDTSLCLSFVCCASL